MQKIKLKGFLAIALILGFTSLQSAIAQGMEEWTWDEYATAFSVPSDFSVIENNVQKFSAGNSAINLTIYPRLDEHLSYREMVSSLRTWAQSSNVEMATEVEYIEDLNGYWGAIVGGVSSNGYPTLLMLAIDPDFPDTSLYIWLQYSEAYEGVAEKIIFSFTPN